jgi:hypothetical protein
VMKSLFVVTAASCLFALAAAAQTPEPDGYVQLPYSGVIGDVVAAPLADTQWTAITWMEGRLVGAPQQRTLYFCANGRLVDRYADGAIYVDGEWLQKEAFMMMQTAKNFAITIGNQYASGVIDAEIRNARGQRGRMRLTKDPAPAPDLIARCGG